MIEPNQLAQWVKEAKESAERFDNEWDRLAVHWPLTSESVVFEIGSFKGRWAYQIATRYNPRLYCFEPQGWAYQVTKNVLEGYNAQVFNFGLTAHGGACLLENYGTDGARFWVGADYATAQKNLPEVPSYSVDHFVTESGVGKIDLCLINIEGYEYTLIPYMMAKNIKPHWLMVQCHGNLADYQKLRDLLSQSYNVLWDYGMTLTAWEIKK